MSGKDGEDVGRGGSGSSSFGEEAWNGAAGRDGTTDLSLDQAIDHDRDGADADQRGSAPVGVQEDRLHDQWTFEKVMGAFDNHLLLEEAEDTRSGRLSGGEVGDQGIQPVTPFGRRQCHLVARPVQLTGVCIELGAQVVADPAARDRSRHAPS